MPFFLSVLINLIIPCWVKVWFFFLSTFIKIKLLKDSAYNDKWFFPFVYFSYLQALYYVGCSRSIRPLLLLVASVIQHFLITMCNTNQFFIGSFEPSISITSCVGHWILCYWGANFSYEGRALLCVCFYTLTALSHTHTLRYIYFYKRDLLYKPGYFSLLCSKCFLFI